MGTTNWGVATERFKRAKQKPVTLQEHNITRCAKALAQFLKSEEGLVALDMLRESDRHIIFGEEDIGSGHTEVFMLNGGGLMQSQEATGTWVAYQKTPSKPTLTPISAEKAVWAFFQLKKKEPDEVMKWLREELNAIAMTAPE